MPLRPARAVLALIAQSCCLGSSTDNAPVITISPQEAPGGPLLRSAGRPDDAQAILDRYRDRPTATFIFGPGTHWVNTLRPHDGQVLAGQRGAVLMGQVNISHRSGVVLQDLNITNTDHGYCVLLLHASKVTISGSDIGPCGSADSNKWDGVHNGTSAPNHQAIVVASSQGVSILDSYIHAEYHATNSSHKPWHIPCVNCPPTHAA
eukprot:COSAG04_NODE_5468_length_1607_cov_1.931034_2_plen_206_part_00